MKRNQSRLAVVLIGLALAWCFVLASLPVAAQGRGGPPLAQGRAARVQTAGTAVIRGQIVAGSTGVPVRRAVVRAVSGTTRGARVVMTDADGRFEIPDLAAGRWELTASKAGFVTMRFGQRRAFEAGRPIELRDGEVIERVDFFLPRGAAITGRIIDEYGEPVAGARLQTLRHQVVQGTRRLVPAGMTAQTDDTGAFRLFGLMPGAYYVSAVLRGVPLDDPSDSTSYAPTYYPGTGSVSDAQLVSVGIGEEISIGFPLMPVRTARLSGIVLSSMGMPLASGSVTLYSAERTGVASAVPGGASRIAADGSFTIANVAPGPYSLTAVSGDARRAGAAEYEMGSMPVAVSGDDVTGLTVVTGRGATISGSIAASPGSGTLVLPTGLQVVAQSAGLDRGANVRPAAVARDGTFRLSNLFGPRVIRISGLPAQWTLESVIVGGRDVTDEAVDFGPAQDVAGARIVLTDRIAEVTGTVMERDGRPSGDFAVVVFPSDESKWTFPSRHLRSARPDQEGLFRMRALPPGEEYLAIAVDYLEEGEGADPDFLTYVKSRATAFNVRPGESTTLNLRLVER